MTEKKLRPGVMYEVSAYARLKLEEMGATYEKREDREGVTRSGWWMDDVWLAKDPRDALNFLEGN